MEYLGILLLKQSRLDQPQLLGEGGGGRGCTVGFFRGRRGKVGAGLETLYHGPVGPWAPRRQ